MKIFRSLLFDKIYLFYNEKYVGSVKTVQV